MGSSNVQRNPLSTGFYALCSCHFAPNVQLKLCAKSCSLFMAYSRAQNHNLTLRVGCTNLKYANRLDEPVFFFFFKQRDKAKLSRTIGKQKQF